MKIKHYLKPTALTALGGLALISTASADFLSPVDATASSNFSGREPADAVNFSGMTGVGTAATHNNNANNRGVAWERPVSVEYINTNGVSGFGLNCGLRMTVVQMGKWL